MQPESSMDPGEISIQKLKEACEIVTITKQRRHIFLHETKRVQDILLNSILLNAILLN